MVILNSALKDDKLPRAAQIVARDILDWLIDSAMVDRAQTQENLISVLNQQLPVGQFLPEHSDAVGEHETGETTTDDDDS
jgi:hypothetical protein